MIKILSIIGARPQIIKAAAFSRAVKNKFSSFINEKILHTGQHYDFNMSQIFFDELDIPKPDFNLNVGSGNHGEQTAKMISGIEQILLNEPFDALLVYGDTNSTLAGAVAASKLHIPIIHIEAGLRSFNMLMPEEINRIVCDHLSSLLFTPTETGFQNLKNEGFFTSKSTFKNGKKRFVFNSGDIMYDNSLHFAQIAEKKSNILQKYNLITDHYVLVTIHRDNNTNDCKRLTAIFTALLDIAEDNNIKIILPLHPRTTKLLQTNLSSVVYKRLNSSKQLFLIPPVSFLEMILLEKNAKIIMTDSGGVQKEAYFFQKPCVILRPETEWVEIVEQNAGIIADADCDRIKKSYRELLNKKITYLPVFGKGQAAEYIVEKIIDYFT
jgi:UDP-GlcNAc3NAcA epimerase